VRTAYKVLAWIIAAEVMVQAAMMVYAIAGLGIWVDSKGGVLDKAAMESEDNLFPEMTGFMIHGINGMNVIPALALILLIVSFFTKVAGASKWAGFVLLAVVVQVTLGLFGHVVAALGALHGINALILFSLAVMAGLRVHRLQRAERATTATAERELV
jgi:hypothetical protein